MSDTSSYVAVSTFIKFLIIFFYCLRDVLSLRRRRRRRRCRHRCCPELVVFHFCLVEYEQEGLNDIVLLP